MPGLNGGKMSSSNPNSFISLSDNPDEVKNKINKYAFSGGKILLKNTENSAETRILMFRFNI